MYRSLLACCLFFFANIISVSAASPAEPYEAFLAKYCIACHGPEHQESELRIDLLSRDFQLGGEANRWAELIERANAGDMPPEGEPRPTQDEIETFVTKVHSLIREGRVARMAALPAVEHYRLSRKEYQNTVYDLLAGLIEFDITAPEDDPQVYEFEVFLEMPMTLHFCVVATDGLDERRGGAFRSALASGAAYVFTHNSETLLLNPNAPQMFEDQGNGLFSTGLLDWIEWEGSLVTPSEKSRRADVLPPEDASPQVVADHLLRFAQRAWRRPVQPEELDDYLQSCWAHREAGETMADAYRIALQGVLTSRNFFYLVEGEPESRSHLTDWELASRLSYFLWSSMPDEGLFAAAENRDLSGDGLTHEVDRMLTDSRIDRFIEDFSRQWLQLHRVGMFPSDRNLYPNYDDWLEVSMRAEAIEYFREMFAKNLPLNDFLDSDWTMVNARLCDFYGLPEPKSGGFERVPFRPEYHRGGLLTMGAVLGLTSDGTRQRPVHRGVWLSEAIFNKTPSPSAAPSSTLPSRTARSLWEVAGSKSN